MRILIDTNVLIDFLSKREHFFKNSVEVIRLCSTGQVEGYVAAHSILDIFFILRKYVPDTNERRRKIRKLTNLFALVAVDGNMIVRSLDDDAFKDFEDCVQAECAARVGADYIVTRNVKDFEKSQVKAITPQDLLEEMQDGSDQD